jgi:hypothetical protein
MANYLIYIEQLHKKKQKSLVNLTRLQCELS